MKQLFSYFVRYFKEEIKWGYFISVLFFGALCIYLQYNYNIEESYVAPFRQEPSFYFRSFLLYFIPFAGTLFLYSAFYRNRQIWLNRSFLFLCLLVLATYVFRCKITFYADWIRELVSPVHQQYWIGISHQLVHGLILFTIPYLYWRINDKNKTGLYGWKMKGVSFKPYFIALMFMVPVMAAACTQKDFLEYYPMAHDFIEGYPDSTDKMLLGGLFEFSYGLDFLMNEFFFRGFIILAFAKWLGRGIILPMAMFYVFIHFGKPLGETISSFFGGLALGIIVFETGSIYGGVILHVGIAWMMEIAAGLMRL